MSPENKRRLIVYPAVLLLLCGLAYGGFIYKAEPDTEVLVNSAEVLSQVGDFEGAIENAERALKQDPDHRYAHVILGYSYSETGKHDAAVAHYRRAVALTGLEDKERSLLRLHLAEAFLAAGRNEEGESEAEAVAREDPTEFKAFFIVGRAREAQGRVQDARTAYLVVRRAAPEDPVPCLLLSHLEESAGDPKAAITWIEKAREAAPDSAEVAVNAARLFLGADRREDAVQALLGVPAKKRALARRIVRRAQLLEVLSGDPRLVDYFPDSGQK